MPGHGDIPDRGLSGPAYEPPPDTSSGPGMPHELLPSAAYGARVDGVRKIAVLRANALGDLVFSLPALAALRAAYADAEIVLLAAPWHASFLAGRPGPVDRVVALPAKRGVREPSPGEEEDEAEVARFQARMRGEGFDLALQLHGGGKFSNPFVSGLGARVTAGLRAPGAPPLDRWVPYVYYHPEVFRYLEAVALVGARPVTLDPVLALTDADECEAASTLAGLPPPYAVLHPGATDPRRRWPAGRFAAVGDALASEGASVLVTGTAADGDVVDLVLAGMRHPARRLVDAVGVGGLAGILARAAVVVSNDTGPLHLAAAVGTSTVGVYWVGNLINGGPLTRGRHRPHVSWTIHCPVCGQDCTRDIYPARGGGGRCGHDPSFVADVALQEVLPDALDLLRRAGERVAVTA